MLLQTVSITLLFGHHQGTMQYHYFSFLIFAALLVGTFGANITFGSARIVGGYDAYPTEFPFVDRSVSTILMAIVSHENGGTRKQICPDKKQVSLRQFNSHICGGSIISDFYVITTAQCVYGIGTSLLTVVAGTNMLSSGGNHYSVSRIVTHPGYNPYNYFNDIALIRVSTPFVFSSTVKYISLVEPGEPVSAASIAIGWGITSYPGSTLSNNLKKVDLTVLSNTACQYYHGSNIFSTNICASGGYGKGVCNGDSGGPLISSFKLNGLVSWGLPCAAGYPDVYTRVSAYIPWITDNAK